MTTVSPASAQPSTARIARARSGSVAKRPGAAPARCTPTTISSMIASGRSERGLSEVTQTWSQRRGRRRSSTRSSSACGGPAPRPAASRPSRIVRARFAPCSAGPRPATRWSSPARVTRPIRSWAPTCCRSTTARSRGGSCRERGPRATVPPFTVQDIVRATQGALVAGDLGIPVTGVSIDSRSLGVGEAFFAIHGHRLDGHAFLADAAARGAACLVVDALPDDVPANVPLVLVEDTTQSLGRLAAFHRSRFAIPVVAVTGSNGKTTTKELAASVLATRWEVLKPERSFNNQWGLPLTLLRLGPEHQAAMLEIGTNARGEIAALAALARPTVAIVTTVAAVHTEFLGSLDGVREEKAGLVRALPPDGVAVLNADDARVAGMARDTQARIVTYGRAASAHVRAVGEATDDEEGLRFTLEAGGERQLVTLALAG